MKLQLREKNSTVEIQNLANSTENSAEVFTADLLLLKKDQRTSK